MPLKRTDRLRGYNFRAAVSLWYMLITLARVMVQFCNFSRLCGKTSDWYFKVIFSGFVTASKMSFRPWDNSLARCILLPDLSQAINKNTPSLFNASTVSNDFSPFLARCARAVSVQPFHEGRPFADATHNSLFQRRTAVAGLQLPPASST